MPPPLLVGHRALGSKSPDFGRKMGRKLSEDLFLLFTDFGRKMGRNLSVTISNSDLCSSQSFWSFCPPPPFKILRTLLLQLRSWLKRAAPLQLRDYSDWYSVLVLRCHYSPPIFLSIKINFKKKLAQKHNDQNIGVARIFELGNHKSHAMTSREIFERGTFCGTKIS